MFDLIIKSDGAPSIFYFSVCETIYKRNCTEVRFSAERGMIKVYHNLKIYDDKIMMDWKRISNYLADTEEIRETQTFFAEEKEARRSIQLPYMELIVLPGTIKIERSRVRTEIKAECLIRTSSSLSKRQNLVLLCKKRATHEQISSRSGETLSIEF